MGVIVLFVVIAYNLRRFLQASFALLRLLLMIGINRDVQALALKEHGVRVFMREHVKVHGALEVL